MTLREFLLYLKVSGETTISVEDVKKLITCDDESIDVKVLHLDPPLDPKIKSYYEGKSNGKIQD